MQTKSYVTIDRASLGWPFGQWDNEPDKMQWADVATGLPCLAVRNPASGNWCGYVGLPPNHPLYGKNDNEDSLRVHGGITFADKCRPGLTESTGICHSPEPGESDDVWWLGFDCHHAWDFTPQDVKLQTERGYQFLIMGDQQYRTLVYVQQQCASLASQLTLNADPVLVLAQTKDDFASFKRLAIDFASFKRLAVDLAKAIVHHAGEIDPPIVEAAKALIVKADKP